VPPANLNGRNLLHREKWVDFRILTLDIRKYFIYNKFAANSAEIIERWR
jgi:hypothetical protein